MSALPVSQPGNASDSAVSLPLDDDDLGRAAAIYARSRDDAERRHAECAAMLAGAHRRDRVFREALHRRMLARVKARFARQFLNQALAEWRPNGGGH